MFLLGVQFQQDPLEKKLLYVLIFLSLITCLYGLHQKWITLPQTIETLGESMKQNSDPLIRDSYNRLLWGRIFSTFRHVNMFAGFIIMMIPITLIPLTKPVNKIASAGVMGLIILELLCLFYTKSVGGIFVLFTLLIAGIGLNFSILKVQMDRKLIRWGSVAILIVFIGLAVAILAARSDTILNSKSNSISMRLANWQIGISMFLDHPLLGVGLGSYGSLYSKYMFPGANPTKFAHNLFIQAAAELGIIGLISITAFFAWFLFTVIRMRDRDWQQRLCLYAGSAYILHNMIDIDFYFSSLSIPAFYLLGCGFKARTVSIQYKVKLIAAAGIGISFGLLFLVYWQYQISLGKTNAEKALKAYQQKNISQSINFQKLALRHDPSNHILLSDYADLLLQNHKNENNLLKDAINLYKQSILVAKTTASYYYRMGILYLRIGDYENAEKSFRSATEFYPLNNEYNETLQRFLEKYKKLPSG